VGLKFNYATEILKNGFGGSGELVVEVFVGELSTFPLSRTT
jgi:hypothetical protein